MMVALYVGVVCLVVASIEAATQAPLLQCVNGQWNATTSKCDCKKGWTSEKCDRRFRDCSEAHAAGYTGQGQLMVQPDTKKAEFPVWCEFDWGGWTFLLRRGEHYRWNNTPQLSFDRTWAEYRQGFGVIRSEAFLGLDNIRLLLKDKSCKLSVGVGFKQAYYDEFWVDTDKNKFKMHYTNYKAWGTKPLADGFGLSGLNDGQFCTKDKDCNNCAADTNSGWWFANNCTANNLHLPDNGIDLGGWPGIAGGVFGMDTKLGVYMMVHHPQV